MRDRRMPHATRTERTNGMEARRQNENESNPALFLDLRRRGIYIKRIWRKLHVVSGLIDKSLIRHVAVMEARNRKRSRYAVHHLVVVVLFCLFVLVLVNRVAPLKGSPQRQVRLRIHLDRDRIIG